MVENGIHTIGQDCFRGMKYLTDVELGSFVQVIAASSFAECASLQTIDLSDCETIEEAAFEGCTRYVSTNI